MSYYSCDVRFFQQKKQKVTRILGVNALIRDGIFKRGRGEGDAKKIRKKWNWWNVLSSQKNPKNLQCHITIKINPTAITCDLIPLGHL